MYNPFKNKGLSNTISSKKDDVKSRSAHNKNTWGKNKGFNKEIKDNLEKRQGCICSYCGNDYSKTSFGQIDHFLPKSVLPQFSYTPENLVLSCQICNSKQKNGKYLCTIPRTVVGLTYPDSSSFKIVHPILDDPKCHFALEDNSLVMKLLTAKAVESNKLFHLNLESVLYRRARIIIEKEFDLSEEAKELIDLILSKPRG